MDWLGIGLPFKQVDFLLEHQFNLEIERLYHLKRLSYIPEILHRSIHSTFFQEFISTFDLNTMTEAQASYGIEWLTILCREHQVIPYIRKLPLQEMICNSHQNVRKASYKLLSSVLKIAIHDDDSLFFSNSLHKFVLNECLNSVESLAFDDCKLIESMFICLSLFIFGYNQNNDSALLNPNDFEKLGILLTNTSNLSVHRLLVIYLKNLAFFQFYRNIIYNCSMLDKIRECRSSPEVDALKQLLSVDPRLKRLLEIN
eukprot:NODE_559_length_6071_cov_0.798895.p4 type:complete len:257 gc:universal NODE_559_length_6071_cov_0.798895:2562-3332(+)